jgi:phenylalanyl-tRNA synthetase alpha chain
MNPVDSPLHRIQNHPIYIIKEEIYKSFPSFDKYEDISPIVDVKDNFDSLLIPEDHPSRTKSDTYYLSDSRVLRTHTSAHQCQILKSGKTQFLVTGDVYRRDSIDRYHYPIFHQMEGVKLCDDPQTDLDLTIKNLLDRLFPGCQVRKTDSYFPFTNPSFEYEVLYEGNWLEVLGCGVIHADILKNCGVIGTGWAFGLGLERLAMILFNIPDIRLFWSKDKRFINQFQDGKIVEFKHYSKFPACYKDIAFWISEDFNHNIFCELVRDIGGDSVESIEEIDKYERNGKRSLCYRINYRDWDRSLTNEEVDAWQERVRYQVASNLNCELR